MKYLFNSFLFLMAASPLLAQTNDAKNVQQKTDDNKIEFSFDLPDEPTAGPHFYYDVRIVTNSTTIFPKTTQRTGNRIRTGKNLSAVWSFSTDGYSLADVASLDVRLVATRTNEKVKEKNNAAFFWLVGGLVAAGGGAMVFLGNRAKNDSDALYSEYKSRQNSLDGSTYGSQNLSREGYFQAANDKYHRAQFLKTTGFVVIGAAVSSLVAWQILKKRKAGKSDAATRFQPKKWDWQPVVGSSSVGVVFSF